MARKAITEFYNRTLLRLVLVEGLEREQVIKNVFVVNTAIEEILDTLKRLEHFPLFKSNNTKLKEPVKLGVALAALHGQRAMQVSNPPVHINEFNANAAKDFLLFARKTIEPDYFTMSLEWGEDPSRDYERLKKTDDVIMARAAWLKALPQTEKISKFGGGQLAATMAGSFVLADGVLNGDEVCQFESSLVKAGATFHSDRALPVPKA